MRHVATQGSGPPITCADRLAERETGSGSIWVLAICGVIATAAAGLMLVAGAVSQNARAAAAADLAALAGADSLQHGGSGGEACGAAAGVAAANGSDVDHCSVDGQFVTVSVVGRAHAFGGLRARATARAGPV